jgi:oligo-1,6-glucosidase
MRREVFAGRDREYLTIGEMPGVTLEEARLFTDPSRGELDMVFQFEHVGLDHGASGKWSPRELDVVELKDSLARWQEGLAEVGWNSLYWSNHDQPRALSRFGDPEHWYASATALATVLHLQRGTPFVYQGEELGMTNVPFESIEQFRDIETLNYFHEAVDEHGLAAPGVLDVIRRASRDNARTPVHWTPDPHAGFTTGEPWIDVHPNYDHINASVQRGRSGSVFEYYRALIALRHRNRIVVDGAFEMLAREHPSVFAFTRSVGSRRLVVAANLSATTVDVPPDVDLRGDVLLTNHPDPARARLRPWEAVVVAQTG